LSQLVTQNIRFALLYNLFAVGLALSGAMRPWLAAVLMPLSSIAVIARTSTTLSKRSRRWKS
jgi:cation transport ATPase